MAACGVEILAVPRSVLSLRHTLPTGQAFRWQQTSEEEWTGVIGNRLYTMTQSEKDISFRVLNNGSSMQADRQVLERYFQLDVDFSELYSQWSATDDFIKTAAGNGVRILRQDPLETLVAFICSSNNNISRISLMMNRLCATYGQPVGEYADQTFYSFPSLKVLTSDKVEAKLRELGFGYRARYVAQAAVYVMAQSAGENWLTSLCDCSYQDAWTQLQQIPGVGPKVADCVCLMALDKSQAVPIDTHILQVAVKHYGVKLHSKSLTRKVYSQIGDMFREKFGEYAGWAQAIMFTREITAGGVKDQKRKSEETEATDSSTTDRKKKRQ